MPIIIYINSNFKTEIKCADVDQQTLQNILSSAQGTASYSARLVAMSKAAFDELAASAQIDLVFRKLLRVAGSADP